MKERVLSHHRFAVIATQRVEEIERAQAIVRKKPGEAEPTIDRAARQAARIVLSRRGVRDREEVAYRRATRNERGRWVVTAGPKVFDVETEEPGWRTR